MEEELAALRARIAELERRAARTEQDITVTLKSKEGERPRYPVAFMSTVHGDWLEKLEKRANAVEKRMDDADEQLFFGANTLRGDVDDLGRDLVYCCKIFRAELNHLWTAVCIALVPLVWHVLHLVGRLVEHLL